MEIVSNKQPRLIIDGYQLTTAERREFDYLSDNEINEATFFRFKGQLYDLGEVMRYDDEYWHGTIGMSAFHAILVHICKDNDCVVIGQSFS